MCRMLRNEQKQLKFINTTLTFFQLKNFMEKNYFSKRKSSATKGPKNRILSFLAVAAMLLSPAWLSAQQRTITGTVTDANSQPISGATITVQGTNNAALTGNDGRFTLGNVGQGVVLTVVHMGHVTQTIDAGSQSVFNIRMADDAQVLDEVVVVGFGTQKKVNLTGAVGTVSADELQDRPVMLASQALQGLVAGLNISQNNGSLDQRASMNIRGRGTIGTNSTGSPLILIDGIEGDINTLNPADIDNISVLKDAAASSIYGSKAAFGVILVTTKRGSRGTTRINYSNNFRWSTPMVLPEYPNSLIFAAYFNDASINAGGTAHFNDAWMQAMKDYQAGKFTSAATANASNNNWEEGFDPNGKDPNGSSTKVGGLDNRDYYKEIFRKWGFSQEHNLSFSGATDNGINYMTSFNYLDQNGLIKYNQDSYDRYSLNARVGFKLSKWIDFQYNIRFSRDVYNRPNSYNNSGLFENIGRQTWPMLPLYDGNGNLFQRIAKSLYYGGDYVNVNDNNNQQVQFKFEPIKNWITTAELAYTIRNGQTHAESFNVPTWNRDNNIIPPTSGSNSIAEDASYRDQFSLNLFSEYSFTLNQDHNFKVLAGMQEQYLETKGFGVSRVGLYSQTMPELALTSGNSNNGTATAPSVRSPSHDESSMIGAFGRINYDYKGRYLFEGNIRYDDSSRFREGHRSVWSPSFSVGWNIAQESFMEPLRNTLSVLKLRGSYGRLSNQNTRGNYPTYSNMSLGSNSGYWLQNNLRTNTAAAPSALENPFMTWEKVYTTNVGLDFALFKNRFTGSFDYYVRRTADMLAAAPARPAVLGTSVPPVNDAELTDKGFELTLAWNDRLQNGLRYGVRFLLSDYQTEVTKYVNNPTNLINTYFPGQKIGDIWGYTTIGIAKTKEEMNAHLATLPNGGQTAFDKTGFSAGDIMYKDVNGDGKVDSGAGTLTNPGDRTIIGNSTPRFQFSLDLNASWKNFDIRAFFQGIAKRDIAPTNTFFWGAAGNGLWWANCFTANLDSYRNADAWSVKNGYMKENLDSYFPRAKFTDGNSQTQTKYLQDASYIRLKNLQVGYTLPEKWTNKLSISRVRVFFSGENLWTLTNVWDLFDPESIDGGWSGNTYPLSKVLSFGVNLNF